MQVLSLTLLAFLSTSFASPLLSAQIPLNSPFPLPGFFNGVFGDHTVKWATKAKTGGEDEIDSRFRAMTPHPTLRHFSKGISLTSQSRWTGNERKNMEKVFLGVLANTTDPAVQRAVAGVIDFIYYAHFETHCDESLAIGQTRRCLGRFPPQQTHLCRPSATHPEALRYQQGPQNEALCRWHPVPWYRRREATYKFGTYLQWAVPGYVADLPGSSQDEDEDPDNEEAVVSPPPPEPE
ncbi:hypothetical protein C8F04DRAFT_1173005 [Mycena alexandri]|uniref:Uncharacterized protein n=1 Tax=Mycena alexandri TaxID=1745969 RepID=A0AAD6TGA5_9AGAR|nr:hypothetical protein C8F04DRAFT_1173005 [Mycena alexandri]